MERADEMRKILMSFETYRCLGTSAEAPCTWSAPSSPTPGSPHSRKIVKIKHLKGMIKICPVSKQNEERKCLQSCRFSCTCKRLWKSLSRAKNKKWMYNVYVWMYTLNVYVFVLSGSPTSPGGSGNLTSVTLPLIPKFHKSFDLEHSLLIRISQYPMQLQATYWIIRSLLAPPSGALVVSQFQDPIPSHPIRI